MLLAIPLLGERIGRWRILATLLAFAGALILTRPIGSGTLLAAEMSGKADGADIATLLDTLAQVDATTFWLFCVSI